MTTFHIRSIANQHIDSASKKLQASSVSSRVTHFAFISLPSQWKSSGRPTPCRCHSLRWSFTFQTCSAMHESPSRSLGCIMQLHRCLLRLQVRGPILASVSRLHLACAYGYGFSRPFSTYLMDWQQGGSISAPSMG